MTYLHTIWEVTSFLITSFLLLLEAIVTSFVPKRYRMKNINGEIALVTGGGGGLGRLLSLRLANLGAIVVVWDINKVGMEETVKVVRAAGGTCYGYVCDLCDREDIYKKAKIIKEEIGKVTILINNAGTATGTKFLDTADTLIIRTMNVNIMSHFWTVKAFLPAMLECNKGHIVSVASMAGQTGAAKLVDYCASKFAAVGFNEALQLELEDEGCNINTTVVCPYFIRSTGMFDEIKSRFFPTLNSNDVADRIITAMRCNEKCAVIPVYFTFLMCMKWIIPWPIISIFLRSMFVDASSKCASTATVTDNEKDLCNLPSKSTVIHQPLAVNRHTCNSERKP